MFSCVCSFPGISVWLSSCHLVCVLLIFVLATQRFLLDWLSFSDRMADVAVFLALQIGPVDLLELGFHVTAAAEAN